MLIAYTKKINLFVLLLRNHLNLTTTNPIPYIDILPFPFWGENLIDSDYRKWICHLELSSIKFHSDWFTHIVLLVRATLRCALLKNSMFPLLQLFIPNTAMILNILSTINL